MQTFNVGDKVRVVRKKYFGEWPVGHIGTITQVDNGTYEVDGNKTSCGWYCDYELVSVEPVYKTWGEMTPEEKGALLLAHHEGKTIQRYYGPENTWVTSNPYWSSTVKYRVKPEETKVETIVKYGYLSSGYWVFGSGPKGAYDTHKITYNTIDGEPDCDSIKMEKL